MPERPVWPRLDAPLWLSPLRARGSCLLDLPDGNCAARSTTHVRLPALAASLLCEREPSRSSSHWFSADGRDLSESREFAVRSPERPMKTAGTSRLFFARGKEANLACAARQSVVKTWKNVLRSQSSSVGPHYTYVHPPCTLTWANPLFLALSTIKKLRGICRVSERRLPSCKEFEPALSPSISSTLMLV